MSKSDSWDCSSNSRPTSRRNQVGVGLGFVAQSGDGQYLAVVVQVSIGQDAGVAEGQVAIADQLLHIVAEGQQLEPELDANGADAGHVRPLFGSADALVRPPPILDMHAARRLCRQGYL